MIREYRTTMNGQERKALLKTKCDLECILNDILLSDWTGVSVTDVILDMSVLLKQVIEQINTRIDYMRWDVEKKTDEKAAGKFEVIKCEASALYDTYMDTGRLCTSLMAEDMPRRVIIKKLMELGESIRNRIEELDPSPVDQEGRAVDD